jgi:hypothetical protein
MQAPISAHHNRLARRSKLPAETLHHQLSDSVPELHIIGDARDAKLSVFANDAAIKIKDGR